MGCISADLTIEGMLADPVVGAAMRADKVDPRAFETLLRDTARRIGRRRPRAAGIAGLAWACGRGASGSVRPW